MNNVSFILNILRDVTESTKYKLKTFGEYIGLIWPLILATYALNKHTTNEFLKPSLELYLYIAIHLLMELSVSGKDSESVS